MVFGSLARFSTPEQCSFFFSLLAHWPHQCSVLLINYKVLNPTRKNKICRFFLSSRNAVHDHIIRIPLIANASTSSHMHCPLLIWTDLFSSSFVWFLLFVLGGSGWFGWKSWLKNALSVKNVSSNTQFTTQSTIFIFNWRPKATTWDKNLKKSKKPSFFKRFIGTV